jgi:FkbM family methyltransferase
MNNNSPLNIYREYLQKNLPHLDLSSLPMGKNAEKTDWENPSTAIELNNFAVIQILEAQNSQDIALRQFYLELAIEALETAVDKENHPLCVAHLAIIKSLTGEVNFAHNLEYSKIIEILPLIFSSQKESIAGLIYLPIFNRNNSKNKEHLELIIKENNSYQQALYLFIADCEQSQTVFYNSSGLRLLNLANQIIPHSFNIKLNLGLSNLFNNLYEGLFSLHQASNLQPENSNITQALYLAYLNLNNQKLANLYLEKGNKFSQNNSHNLTWKWANLPITNNWTYLKFDDNLLLTVEASFKSIVTAVLLAQEDWFEVEMEMWRDEIKSGMTVIDVGANVGVYTFSAANRVGENGKVIAVEPFSKCVECLEETRKINNLQWVEICAGAAGESNKTVKLSLHQASELNEIIKDGSDITGNYEEVECFTLDSLVEKHQLSIVHWLKLDAEGNEIEVLQGSSRILSEFKPHILYENIAGIHSSNIPVAEFLLSIGYELFYYQPFLKQLIKLESLEELSGKLNIIAQHSEK